MILHGYLVVCARAGLKTSCLYLIWYFLLSLCLTVYYLHLKNIVILKLFQSDLCVGPISV